MVYKIPDGFDELVRLVMKENPVTERSIPDDKEDDLAEDLKEFLA